MVELVFQNVDLKPGFADGGRTIVGPIPMLANLANRAWIVARAKAGVTTAQFTVKTNSLSGLQTIDSSLVNTTVLTMSAQVLVKSAEDVDEIWLELATEEASAATCDIIVRIRTAEDDAGTGGAAGGGKF